MSLRRLRCLFGHEGGPGTKVGDAIFADCWRCGKRVIRGLGGRWYAVPGRRDGLSPAPAELGPIDANRLLRRARSEAPFLHRRRSRRVRAMDAYFW